MRVEPDGGFVSPRTSEAADVPYIDTRKLRHTFANLAMTYRRPLNLHASTEPPFDYNPRPDQISKPFCPVNTQSEPN